MASMWTGTWPNRNGITRWSHSMPPEATLPAEIFQQAGFQTAGIWRNGWVAPNFGFQQGFDTYLRPLPGMGPDRFQKKTPSSASVVGTDEDLTMAATEFLHAYGHQRFFLYLHYMDVHQYAYDEASSKFGTTLLGRLRQQHQLGRSQRRRAAARSSRTATSSARR